MKNNVYIYYAVDEIAEYELALRFNGKEWVVTRSTFYLLPGGANNQTWRQNAAHHIPTRHWDMAKKSAKRTMELNS